MTETEPSPGQLRWRCRRGMRELDAALLCYLEHHYGTGSEDERLAFQELLDMPDPELMRLIAGKPLNTYPLVPEPDMDSPSSNSGIGSTNLSQGSDDNESNTTNKTDVVAAATGRTATGAVPLPEQRYGPIIEKIRTTLTA